MKYLIYISLFLPLVLGAQVTLIGVSGLGSTDGNNYADSISVTSRNDTTRIITINRLGLGPISSNFTIPSVNSDNSESLWQEGTDNEIYYNENFGNVGIGLNDPNSLLHLLSHTMNEALFEERLATRLEITPTKANTIVNAVKAEICESLKIYGKLTLKGVVTFETRAYGMTSGTTPHGQVWNKEPHTRVYTRSGDTIKAKVNEAPELPVNPETPEIPVVTDNP